ncbi:MAG: glycerate kinase [Ardenticatenia bacterium]|nr:glycerate kinase [Ardenticatenia bacterium]
MGTRERADIPPPWELVSHLVRAALGAADPAAAVRRAVRLKGDHLHVAGHVYDLSRFAHVYVIGAGKASATMARAVEEIVGDRVAGGIVITKYGYTCPTRRVVVREAGHPVPDEAGVRATHEMMALASRAGPDDLVLALISGGGSALLVAPSEGLTLRDLQETTALLLRAGATINELNVVRKHLSAVKGGRLARHVAPALLVTLVVSDVVGNPLDVIASGPTVPDPTTFVDAWQVLARFGLTERVPPSVQRHLRAGAAGRVPETPKPDDPVFQAVRNVIVADNRRAAEAAAARARDLGYHALVLTTFLEGEAREVGTVLAALAQEMAAFGRPLPRPGCAVLGGETTVTVRGDGMGGRNQEMALSAALRLEGLENIVVATLATDGGDGPTDAAGAVVDGQTARLARERGINIREALARNDSYHALKALGALLRTGPTGTNVNDVAFVIAGPPRPATHP